MNNSRQGIQVGWTRAAVAARAGDRCLSVVALLLIVSLLLFGGYSLWDTAMTYLGAFSNSDLLKYKPTGEFDDLSLMELHKLNPDVCAWLTVDDTHIDYPVVQGEDNLEYVNKDVFGEFSFSGTLFLDSRNKRDFSDNYSLIYGHHMDNGAMFGDLLEFTQKEYFDTHKTGIVYLLDNTQLPISLFACVEINSGDSIVYKPENQVKDNSSLLAYLKKISVQYREIEVKETDRIIGLSTCADAVSNGRVVLFGRLEGGKTSESDSQPTMQIESKK